MTIIENIAIWLDFNRNAKLFFLFYSLLENGKVLKILKTFFVKTRTRPRLYCLSSRRLETKTLVSRTTSLIL